MYEETSSAESSALRNLAVFIDIENFGDGGFDTKRVLDRLKERGRLIVKKAYADWLHKKAFISAMLENSVELIQLPRHNNNKNMADIKIVVDALETAITRDYIDTFVVVSGDSDFTPLISKLREYNKYVIVIGAKGQVSRLMEGYCDELIYYSSLIGEETLSESDIQDAFDLMIRVIRSLKDQGRDTISSQIKQHMRKQRASFNESNYGFKQFKFFLERARETGLIDLKTEANGEYRVSLRSSNGVPKTVPPVVTAPVAVSREMPVRQPPAQPKVPLDLTTWIYWAIRVNQVPGETRIRADRVIQTLKRELPLPNEVDLKDYGYTRNMGSTKVIRDIQQQDETFALLRDDAQSQEMIVLNERYENRMQAQPFPSSIEMRRYENLLKKFGYCSNLQLILDTASDVDEYLQQLQDEGESVSINELKSRYLRWLDEAGRDCHPTLVDRVFQTLLQSRAFLDTEGQAILNPGPEGDPPPVDCVMEEDELQERCLQTLERIFEERYGEVLNRDCLLSELGAEAEEDGVYE